MSERAKRGSLGIGAHSSKEYMRKYMRLYRRKHKPILTQELKMLREKAEKYDLLFGD